MFCMLAKRNPSGKVLTLRKNQIQRPSIEYDEQCYQPIPFRLEHLEYSQVLWEDDQTSRNLNTNIKNKIWNLLAKLEERILYKCGSKKARA